MVSEALVHVLLAPSAVGSVARQWYIMAGAYGVTKMLNIVAARKRKRHRSGSPVLLLRNYPAPHNDLTSSHKADLLEAPALPNSTMGRGGGTFKPIGNISDPHYIT